ncbi:hypothetical protein A2W13_00735 [Candidatus Woesebacteria bacterium RBG_16_36_11]|uniref:PpiC domain-containing protein n=2 Tax=Candidatus Woeseibacteriota TaxID=1752722 RepID=A0A1F7XCX1_9BACT|nr:MAG: hypothetical protein A2W13_00735 [Candidatus Woesebacteria bacterium RBG_16_36_11]OGM16507.1 MAG: hypothetical protein A2V55_02400 [Candidatus Woesebacteria bacterium RBG_19FT_COMBO_37_29]
MSLKTSLNKTKESVTSYKKSIIKNPRKRWTLIIGFIVVVILVLAYANMGIFIAAIVNGKPITRLQLAQELEKQGGKQVLDSIVTQKLIDQEAKKNNIVVTQQEIDNQMTAIEDQLKSQGTDLDTALSFQGQTRDDLINSLKMKITIEKLLGDKIQVSDEEIKSYFDQNKDSFPANSKLEDVKSQIIDTLTQSKLSTEYQNWLQNIKANSKIDYLLNF